MSKYTDEELLGILTNDIAFAWLSTTDPDSVVEVDDEREAVVEVHDTSTTIDAASAAASRVLRTLRSIDVV